MKKSHMTAILLSAAMFMPMVMELQSAAEEVQTSGLSSPLQFNAVQSVQPRGGNLAAVQSDQVLPEMATADAFPERYDLREEGLVTSVKSQSPYGTCWSFAAMASLESTLIEKNPDVDLSEWHAAYYAYADAMGFPGQPEYEDELDLFSNGGNYYMMSAMLMGWVSPVDESIFPYKDESVLDPDKTLEELRAESQYHVSGTKLLFDTYQDASDGMEREQYIAMMKQSLLEGHVLSLSYFHEGSYYQGENHAYFYNGDYSSGGYHAVSVVGWDDTFSAEKFTETPDQDGAWLVRNSWGPEDDECGYFWLSYADASLVEVYYAETEDFAKHDKNYQYDDYGYWTALSISDDPENLDTSAYMANVFTAEEDTYITSAMFCTALYNEDYEITVYTGLTQEDDPTSGIASAATTGTQPYMGYHTVDLVAPVYVQAGEQFSVVVKLSGQAGMHLTAESAYTSTTTYPDGTVESASTMVSSDMLMRDFHQGESFYSSNARRWNDVYNEQLSDTITYEDENGDTVTLEYFQQIGNFCIKALTKSGDAVLFSERSGEVAGNTDIHFSTPSEEPIYYSVNGGEEQLYTEPLFFDGSETLAVTARVGDTVTKAVFKPQYSYISSLLVYDGLDYQYLDFTETAPGEFSAVYSCDPTSLPVSLELFPISTGFVRTFDETQILTKTGMTTVEVIEESSGSCITLQAIEEYKRVSTYTIWIGEQPFVRGDVNLDGVVNAKDASQVLIYAAKVSAGQPVSLPDEDWPLRGDFNEDGSVDAKDASAILIYAAESAVA